MKKLLFVGILFVYGISSSQEYIPMLEEGNAWGVRSTEDFMGTEYYQFHLSENVTVNNLVYKRIFYNEEPTECLLRESEGIIYHLDSSNNEKVLFDFTLEVGDVFERNRVNCIPGSSSDTSILSVSYEFIAGQERKVLEYNWPDPEKIIEGIGSTLGGLVSGMFWIEGNWDLVCFINNGETYYFNNYTECNIVLNTNDFLINEITLYPNPLTIKSIINLTIEAKIDQIIIYDIYGKLIKNEIITKEYYRLNAMNYASGLYLYQVFSKGTIIKTNQFIVK